MTKLSDFSIDWSQAEDFVQNALPDGTYAAQITASDIRDTKNGAGKYVFLEFTLLGAPGVRGRKVFERCMIQHTSQGCVGVGLSRLARIGEVTGVNYSEMEDTSELHAKPLGIKIKTKTTEDYGDQIEVKGILKFNESLLEPAGNVAGF